RGHDPHDTHLAGVPGGRLAAAGGGAQGTRPVGCYRREGAGCVGPAVDAGPHDRGGPVTTRTGIVRVATSRDRTVAVLSERLFHDHPAHERSPTFTPPPDALSVDAPAYLDHETWIRPALARLGDVRGLHVLDYGCGHGMASVVLARRGARATA